MNTLRATMRQLLLAGSLIALLPPVAIAYDFDTGLAAAQAGDCTTAHEELRPLAEQGHADAQFNMGVMHVDGEGVPRDCAEGARWMRLAAEQGNALAQFALRALYYEATACLRMTSQHACGSTSALQTGANGLNIEFLRTPRKRRLNGQQKRNAALASAWKASAKTATDCGQQ